jgi:hypothetical protein
MFFMGFMVKNKLSDTLWYCRIDIHGKKQKSRLEWIFT